jgi:DNA-binding NarL/FixJ family response regulator
MIRILLVDDQGLMLEGLRTILNLEEDFEVVATAKNGEEAIRQTEAVQPDLVVLDIRSPCDESIAVLNHIKQHYPSIKVLGLSSYDNDECVLGALRAGVDGYLLKDSPSEELIRAIRSVVAGGVTLAPPVALRVVTHVRRLLESEERQPRARISVRHQLTERELEVLRLVAQGLSNREISKSLFVTEGTVKNHVSSICQKLGARDRTQIAVFAWRNSIADEA